MCKALSLSMLLAAGISLPLLAAEPPEHFRPIAADQLAHYRLPVHTLQGDGEATLELSRDWRQPQPGITRALIVIHGRLRNAETYFQSGVTAARAANALDDTLVIAPQFLATPDIAPRALGQDVLRWTPESWMGGFAAEAPAPVSSFSVLDGILAELSDRKRFPALREVVVAGHSGGGQVVQRYAVAMPGAPALEKAGVALRFVVANPSSYAYFDAERPVAVDQAACPGFDNWKYGMGERPAYLAAATAEQLERRYVMRPVTYLLGERDIDPHHPALDKSCEAEAEGPFRLARGKAYFHYLQQRHPRQFAQRLLTVAGVGHDGDRMFTSPTGVEAIFGHSSSAGQSR